jgi:hypothetical protein
MASLGHATIGHEQDQGVSSTPLRSRALARLATTGIYLLRGVSHGVQRAARARAVNEGTTLRWVLVQALREYAAGSWTPRADDTSPGSAGPAGTYGPLTPAGVATKMVKP